jgi:hypothetical protein
VKAYLADIWDARQLVIRGQAADAGATPRPHGYGYRTLNVM